MFYYYLVVNLYIDKNNSNLLELYCKFHLIKIKYIKFENDVMISWLQQTKYCQYKVNLFKIKI